MSVAYWATVKALNAMDATGDGASVEKPLMSERRERVRDQTEDQRTEGQAMRWGLSQVQRLSAEP